jgi:hypothetical protein
VQRRRIEESTGFASGSAWAGLESLRAELAESDSACLEAVAAKSGQELGAWCANVVLPCARRSQLAPLPPAAWSGRSWVCVEPSSLDRQGTDERDESVGA